MSTKDIEMLAESIAYVYGGAEVRDTDREEAAEMVDYLHKAGWRLIQDSEHVSDGPIQRALGMGD